jgi:hypothetical protein
VYDCIKYGKREGPMKKIKIGILVLLLIFSSYCAFSQLDDFSRSGGDEWNSYNASTKMGFTLGFIVGVHKSLEQLDIIIRQSSYREERAEDLLPVYNISNSQLREALDNFYSIPDNRPIPIKDASIIVCNEIKAKDRERIEKEKKVLRLPPEEQRIVKRSGYLKEKIKRGEYAKYEVKEEKVVEKESGKVIPLETEEEIVDFWTEQVFPEEAPKIKEVEVVKTDYTLAIVVSVIAALAILLILFTVKKRSGGGRKDNPR